MPSNIEYHTDKCMIGADAIGLMNSGAERASFLISGLGSWVRPCLLGPKLSVDRSTEFLDWSLGIRGSISRSLPHKQEVSTIMADQTEGNLARFSSS